jgi:hypothetical protein
MTFNGIMIFINKLIEEGFTGRLILDFHEGKVSQKIKMETTQFVGEER